MNCEGHVELALRACCSVCLLVKFEVEGVVWAANGVLARAHLSAGLRHLPTGFGYTTALTTSTTALTRSTSTLGIGDGDWCFCR